VLEIAVVKDMFGKALRRGFDELSKWAEQRHVEREVDRGLDLWDAEAAVGEAIAEVFNASVHSADWATHLVAVCWPAEDWQQMMEVSCRQARSSVSETNVGLKTNVSSVLEEDEEVNKRFMPRLLPDPPAAVFDPAIRDLDALAEEVMRRVGGQRGRLKKVFESAEFEIQIPLPRREAVEAFRGPFEKLPAYEGDVGLTSHLRIEDVAVGAGSVSLWMSIHQEPDDSRVTVGVECHLRSGDERPEVERRLDHVVARLRA
jgi:hypothetical protein